MPVGDWDADHTLITTLEGENVSEGVMLPPQVNNLFRKMAAQLRIWFNKSYCTDKNVTIQASGGAAPSSPIEGHLWMEY